MNDIYERAAKRLYQRPWANLSAEERAEVELEVDAVLEPDGAEDCDE